MTGRPRLLDRLLVALVRLLPADFRSDFGAAIEADLAERRMAGDRSGMIRRELPGLVTAIIREHASAFMTDARYALRTMRRTPGFTATAVLMLALGTGVNAAVFSVVDAVMLQSPFRDPGQIATVRVAENGKTDKFTAAVTVERYAELAGAPGPFAAIAAMDLGPHILTGPGDPQQIDVECVSASMWEVLGTRPLLGRTFDATEDRAGAAPVMVLSYDFWRRLGDPSSVLGAALTINRTPVTVVGIMPRGFSGPLSRSDVAAWVPLARPIAGGGASGCTGSMWVNAFARLRDGLSVDRMARSIPGVSLWRVDAQTVEEVRTPFVVLTAAVACVLLIACFNVGGLQMERTLARRREMALRLALGASRGRLVRQTLTENLLLALVGGVAGVVATALALGAIVSLLPASLPHLGEIAVNARVLAAAIAVASTAGVIAGLIPVWQTRRFNPAADLAGGVRSTERRGTWTRRSLVVVEVALSIVLLIGAALLIQTFLTLRPTSPGFDPARKTGIIVRLPGATPDESARFFTQLFDALATAPDIRGLAGTTYLPMWGNTRLATWSFGETTTSANTNSTTPGYFDLMKIPVTAGRAFTADDTNASQPVVIVNEALATRISPDGRVVGRRISVGPWTPPGLPSRPHGPPVEREIVGVIANTRAFGSSMRVAPEAYIPFAQNPISNVFVIAESDARDLTAISGELRAAVRALRPDLAVQDVGPMTAWLGQRVSRQRFNAWLLGTFAALAVGLAAIGLMTTIGWWVNQRTKEIGVRVTLGATRGQVGRLVFRQGMALGVTGIAAGCVAAMWLTRYLEGSIYGVTPLDPRTFAACAGIMLIVAACAVYLPMRRATSVDPVIALRSE